MLGLTRGELGLVIFLLVIITAGGKLPHIADAIARLVGRSGGQGDGHGR